MTLRLPWPPSTNRVWRNLSGRTVMSAEGRTFRANALADITGQGAPRIKGPVSITLDLYPPTRQRMDADNRIKSTLDALQHAGVIEDDSLVQQLTVTKHPSEGKPGRAVVTISPWREA